MNVYEHLKHDFVSKVSWLIPELNSQTLSQIATALDEVSARYRICEAETHLSVIGRDEFEKVVKNYIVVRHMEGMSETTVKNYMRTLRAFMLDSSKPLRELTANDIRMYLFKYQSKNGVTNRTLEQIRGVICTFMRWAASEGYIPTNPVETLKPIKWTAKPREALEQIELEEIRQACRTDREKAIIEVLYSTGCRVSELTSIKLSDIDWNTRSVSLLGKGKKWRTSYINAKAEVAIKTYLSRRSHESAYLFINDRGGAKMDKNNVERMIRVIRQRAGMGDRRITPHTFRHTTATQALQSGMPVTDIQQLLGHASVNTTMVYAHVSNEDVRAGHKRCIV